MGEDMSSSLGTRVRRAREAAGLSQQELARAVGIKQPSIQAIESGRAKGSKHLVAIARATGASADWLAAGDHHGNPAERVVLFERKPEPASDNIVNIMGTEYARVPVFDMREGWPMRQPFDHHMMGLALLRSMTGAALSEIAILQVDGDAMSPTVSGRDWVVVDKSLNRIAGSGLYVLHTAGAVVVQRVVRHAGSGAITLTSDNPKYPPQTIDDALKVASVGRVLMTIVRC